MKVNYGIIKFIALTAIIVFLFSFTKNRNSSRKLTGINIEFVDKNDPFITLGAVNKLLIQNQDSVTHINKETLVLKELEDRLLKNEMIRDAEVFVTVDGVLGAKIEQRNPIARVAVLPDYYLDDDGKKMPLSSVYSARVPIVTGISKDNFEEITTLVLKINEDDFMQNSVIGIQVSRNGMVTIQMRKHDFKILFGQINNIEKKFQNFKAFYQKTKKDTTLATYKTVNLQFGNQVVATKK